MRSVLGQYDADFEFIAIDDASNDGSRAILERIAAEDARVIPIYRERNVGLTKNLNYGIEIARGAFVARIDSDDVWHAEDKLTRQIAFLEANSDYALLGTWCALRGERNGAFRWPTDDGAIRNRLLIENCFVHASVVYRTDLARELGGYREGTYCEDYELWMRMGQKAKFANLPAELMTYTYSNSGVSRTKRHQQIRDCLRAVETNHAGYPNYLRAQIKWRGLLLRLAIGSTLANAKGPPKTTA